MGQQECFQVQKKTCMRDLRQDAAGEFGTYSRVNTVKSIEPNSSSCRKTRDGEMMCTNITKHV